VFFEFDRAFVTYQYADFMLDNAVTWLAAAKPRRVVVTGFAATLPDEVSGQSLSERPQIARERAEKVAESLRRMIPGLSIEIRTGLAAEPVDHPDADGLPSQSRRRVEIAAEF
jgi:outer membrane protein OmpA-like peptidoglycan-associated protein